MQSDERDSPTDPLSRPTSPVDRTEPQLRARTLFAQSSDEFPLWDAVARQLDSSSAMPPAPGVTESYVRLRARMASASIPALASMAGVDSSRTRAHPRIRLFPLVVTIMAVLVAAGLFGTLRGRDVSPSSGFASVTYMTRNAERTEVTLSDGTNVLLNVGSRLDVPHAYGAPSRTVYLEGEAQFIVDHDPAHPFVVHAGNTVVRDLATRFVVRAYRDVGKTSVAVADGRVEVRAATLSQPASTTLNAGQLAVVTLETGMRVETRSTLADFFSWTDGDLTFTHTPVGEALAQISRWYNVECHVTDPALLTTDLTFAFQGPTLSDRQLQDLGDVLGAHIQRQGQVLTFTPRDDAVRGSDRSTSTREVR